MSDVTPIDSPTPQNTPKHPQMTITDFNYESSYLPSLICNMDVRVHIGRSTPYRHLVAKNGSFRFLLLQVIQADQLADLHPKLSIDALHTITPNLGDLPPNQA